MCLSELSRPAWGVLTWLSPTVSFPFTHRVPDPTFIIPTETCRNICLVLVTPLSHSISPKAGLPHPLLVSFYSAAIFVNRHSLTFGKSHFIPNVF